MEDIYQDDTLLARWLCGDLSEAEQEALERHPDFPTLRRIVELSDQLELPDPAVQAMWDRLSPQLLAPKPVVPERDTRRIWLSWAVAAAAVLVLFFFTWTLLQSTRTTPEMAATAIGEQKTVTLPDGSTVRLNAVSSLEVFTNNWARARKVHLIGEAFFKVEKGMAPFLVETSAGSVSVLGTSFTVMQRGGAFEVACYTGLVQASIPNGEQQALREGQKAVARNGQWQPIGALTDSWPSWMQGESRFANAPVYEVLAELQRQYHIKINAAGTGGRRFSGAFVHGDLPLALRMVCDPLDLKYEIQGNTVRIWKE